MANLVEILASIPGVASTCIYDARAVNKQGSSSGPLTAEAAERVGRSLLKLTQMGQPHAMDIQSCFFRLDRYTVIGMPLEEHKLLLAVCEPQANSLLIASTIERHIQSTDDPGGNFPLDFQVIDADK